MENTTSQQEISHVVVQPSVSAATTPHKLLPVVIAIVLMIIAGIGGYVLGMQRVTQVTIQEDLIPSPKATAENPTASWETYQGSAYSFKHPAGLKSDTDAAGAGTDSVRFSFMGQKQIATGRTQTSLFDGYMFIVTNRGSSATLNAKKSAEEAVKNSNENCGTGEAVSSLKEVAIAGKTGFQYSSTCYGDSTSTFVENEGKVYEITQFYAGDEVDYPVYKKITEQIFSTFAFEKKQTNGLPNSVLCTNKTLGMSISLPDTTWSCKNTEEGQTTSISSNKFNVTITSLGRGNFCDPPDTDPNSPRYNSDPNSCVITPFVVNEVLDMKLFTSYGVDREIFGVIRNGASISVSLKDQNSKKFSEDDKTIIKSLLNSVKKI